LRIYFKYILVTELEYPCYTFMSSFPVQDENSHHILYRRFFLCWAMARHKKTLFKTVASLDIKNHFSRQYNDRTNISSHSREVNFSSIGALTICYNSFGIHTTRIWIKWTNSIGTTKLKCNVKSVKLAESVHIFRQKLHRHLLDKYVDIP